MTDDIDTLQMRVKYLEYLEKENKELRQKGTLRDQFAMTALNALMSRDSSGDVWDSCGPTDPDGAIMAYAISAYQFADAMMASKAEAV